MYFSLVSFFQKVRRSAYHGPIGHLWLAPFVVAVRVVRARRFEAAMSLAHLWREDPFSRELNEWNPEDVPGDILGLRCLYEMLPFPGPVNNGSWDECWALFGPS